MRSALPLLNSGFWILNSSVKRGVFNGVTAGVWTGTIFLAALPAGRGSECCVTATLKERRVVFAYTAA
jgi:hypothetical protein